MKHIVFFFLSLSAGVFVPVVSTGDTIHIPGERKKEKNNMLHLLSSPLNYRGI
jgi:hypothetical protein